MEMPEIKEIYGGTKGSTHGEKKAMSPPKNATI
jgi:hypothetical protein